MDPDAPPVDTAALPPPRRPEVVTQRRAATPVVLLVVATGAALAAGVGAGLAATVRAFAPAAWPDAVARSDVQVAAVVVAVLVSLVTAAMLATARASVRLRAWTLLMAGLATLGLLVAAAGALELVSSDAWPWSLVVLVGSVAVPLWTAAMAAVGRRHGDAAIARARNLDASWRRSIRLAMTAAIGLGLLLVFEATYLRAFSFRVEAWTMSSLAAARGLVAFAVGHAFVSGVRTLLVARDHEWVVRLHRSTYVLLLLLLTAVPVAVLLVDEPDVRGVLQGALGLP